MSLFDEASVSKPEPEPEAPQPQSQGGSYGKRLREKRIAAANKIKDVLARAAIELTADEQTAMDILCGVRQGGRGREKVDWFHQIFSNGATSAPVLDVFQKFKKGYPEMKKLIKQWAADGTATVKLVDDAYVIQ